MISLILEQFKIYLPLYLGLVNCVVSLRRGGAGRLVGDRERFSENGGPACACCGDVAAAICMGAASGFGIVGGGLTQLAWVCRHSSCLGGCCCGCCW